MRGVVAMNPLKEIKDDVTIYFESLGYEVTWDFSARDREHWYEILKDGELICQFDMGVPISRLLKDIPRFLQGKSGTDGPPYRFNCEDDDELRELYQRMKGKPPDPSKSIRETALRQVRGDESRDAPEHECERCRFMEFRLAAVRKAIGCADGASLEQVLAAIERMNAKDP